ncbi:MAG TPA: DNA polymerase III subunit delta' [Ktedonobacterales bacterium]
MSDRDEPLATVVGMRQARAILASAATSGEMSHAWLLSGLSGIGKRTLAVATAALLNCQDRPPGSANACGHCASCRLIARGSHPDVVVVAGDESASAKVDNVREVVALANMHPSMGRWRVFIITAVDELLPHAANALLKPLEEPPPATVLLLTAVQLDRVLPTIISRCKPLPLQPASLAEIRAALESRWGVPAEDAAQIAALSGGRMAWAVAAIEQPELRQQRESDVERLMRLPSLGRAERLRIAPELAPNQDGAQQTISLWLALWRDVVLAAHGAENLAATGSVRRRAESLGKALGPDRAESFVHALLRAQTALEENGNPRLTLDVVLLDLPSVSL